VTGLCRSECEAEVIGAEPLLGNDGARSLRAGQLVANSEEPMTIADGARTISLGKRNWNIIRSSVKEIIEVPDETIEEAMRVYFGLANLKAEPTRALSLGAVLLNTARFEGKRVCVLVSGGNVDPNVYSTIITQ
jgi:threonine dehydratase